MFVQPPSSFLFFSFIKEKDKKYDYICYSSRLFNLFHL